MTVRCTFLAGRVTAEATNITRRLPRFSGLPILPLPSIYHSVMPNLQPGFGRGSSLVRTIIAGSSLTEKRNFGKFRFSKMAA